MLVMTKVYMTSLENKDFLPTFAFLKLNLDELDDFRLLVADWNLHSLQINV